MHPEDCDCKDCWKSRAKEWERESGEWREQARVSDLRNTTIAFQNNTLRRALEKIEPFCKVKYGMDEDAVDGISQALAIEPTQEEKKLEEIHEYLKGVGCDCGTDEPGTCGLCVMNGLVKGGA